MLTNHGVSGDDEKHNAHKVKATWPKPGILRGKLNHYHE